MRRTHGWLAKSVASRRRGLLLFGCGHPHPVSVDHSSLRYILSEVLVCFGADENTDFLSKERKIRLIAVKR